jgi:hypothetical protein
VAKSGSKQRKRARDVDQMLRLLNERAEDSDTEFRITLDVRGSIVSGLLVSQTSWLELWSKQVDEDWRAELRDLFESAASEGDTRSDGFLHLKDAQYWHGPEPLPTNMTFLWRGRLSEVSGWAEGSLSA